MSRSIGACDAGAEEGATSPTAGPVMTPWGSAGRPSVQPQDLYYVRVTPTTGGSGALPDPHQSIPAPPVHPVPTEAAARKTYPLVTGLLDYFPDALAEVAHVSYVGNAQHNPGTPCHWDRAKSRDEADALLRHLLERGKFDTDGCRHSAKVAWRALALLQKELEGEIG